ncbi:MAG TPA: hypothetical protein VGL38_07645 [bacterium]|jgi:hypothetical protein
MKHTLLAVIAAGLAVLILTAGCNKSLKQTIERAKGNAAEEQRAEERAVQDSESDYMDEWQAFRGNAEKQIAANAVTIDELKAKAAGADEKVRAKFSATVDVLVQKNKELKGKLDAYQDEGKINWDAFKRDFSHDLESLGQSLKDLDATAKK